MTHRRSVYIAYLLLLPALLCLAIFRLYPIATTLIGSLYSQSIMQAGKDVFVGLNNYLHLFRDPVFWQSLWVTVKLNVVINPLQVLIALGLAIMVNQRFRGISLYRLLFFIPLGVSLPIASILWRTLLDPNSGLINSMLNIIGVGPQPFLIDKDQALWCIVAIATWKGASFWMIFLWAGLQDIPAPLYEAARIDGAGPFGQFFRITFPLLRRPLLFVLITDTAVNFLLFVPMFLLTRGGPSYATNVLMYEAYKSGFIYGDMGRSLALVTVLLLLVIATVALQFQLFSQEDQS
jgi:multiple sugar transport system permease protein